MYNELFYINGGAMRFADRSEAGKALAHELQKVSRGKCIVFAIPRGGVPVAAEVVKVLGAPLFPVYAHKIGMPNESEYAIAAVGERGSLETYTDLSRLFRSGWFCEELQHQKNEFSHKHEVYKSAINSDDLTGYTAIIVDDGMATGLTMKAAVDEIRRLHPDKIVVAVPIASPESAIHLRDDVDELVCVYIPPVFQGAVGYYYDSFDSVDDEQVGVLLTQAQHYSL